MFIGATTAAWLLSAALAFAASPEEFVDSAFPYIAGEGGMPALPAGTKASPDRPGHRYLKVPKAGGGTAHLYASGPFAFDDGGSIQSVNTDLVATGGGWQPASVPFDVLIPEDLADGIVWRDAASGESVRIYPQNLNNAPGRLYEGSTDTVIYDEVWNRTYMTVAVTTHGIKDHIILTQANGVPSQFKFRVERPAGAQTRLTSAGGVQVVASGGSVLAELPAPVGRDRDHQEFAVWYEVESHGGFDVIVLKYDTSPITAEGTTVTFEAPFDLDPTIYSGTLVHGENAFRETSLNAYTVSDFNDGNLKVSLLTWPEYPAGKFARWWITPPPAGSRWYSFSARVEGRVGQGQHYTLKDDAGTRYEFGPASAPGTYFAQNVNFTPQGDLNHRIEATQTITPQYDYYGQLTNPVVVYEDLVDPTLTDLRPNNTTVSSSQVTLNLAMSDAQSGCGSITVTLHGPIAPIATKTGSGCSFAPVFDLRTEGSHRIDVTLTDRSGRQTSTSGSFNFDSPVDPPHPPVVDGLDPANDIAWTNQTSTFSAAWNSALGATTYQLCFTAATSCDPDDRWTGFSATSGTVGGYGFQHGNLVTACVRSITNEGVRTVPTCSNGQRVDLVPPSSPEFVNDGDGDGDVDETQSTLDASSNWGEATDESGQILTYETCYKLVVEPCTAGHWASPEDPGLRRESASLQMLPNEHRQACVRAADPAGNVSQASCSDGYIVRAAETEIESAILDRANAGLRADPEYVRSRIQQGAFNEYWVESLPVATGEYDDLVRYAEFQTWLIDNEVALSELRAAGDITVDVNPVTKRLIVTIPRRACSPRVEIRRAIGNKAYRAVALGVRQRPFVPVSTAKVRLLVKRELYSSDAFRELGLKGMQIRRRGIASRCLDAMAGWFNDERVKSRLLEGFDLKYAVAEPDDDNQHLLLYSEASVRLYRGSTSRRPMLIRRASTGSSEATSGGSDLCPRWNNLGRNTFYCEQRFLWSGTLYHSRDRRGISPPQYGGCSFGFPVFRGAVSALPTYILTAKHCHDRVKDTTTGQWVEYPNTAYTSWHSTLEGRFADLRTQIGSAQEVFEDDIADITAIRTNSMRVGAYMAPLPTSRRTPRSIVVDNSHGVVKNSPLVAGSTSLTVISSRSSAEVKNGPEPNGLAKGYFRKNTVNRWDNLYGESYAFISNMKACQGDSGSGLYVRTVKNGKFVYRPFGIHSRDWAPDDKYKLQYLYGWKSNQRYYPATPGSTDYQTQCGVSSLMAPAWGYVRRYGMSLWGTGG